MTSTAFVAEKPSAPPASKTKACAVKEKGRPTLAGSEPVTLISPRWLSGSAILADRVISILDLKMLDQLRV